MADKYSSPLILKYQKDYEEKPQSRVFVPLAESYRKVGLVDKAISILRDGLEFHPNYVTAHVVLGNCYFDQEKYERALRILSPLFDSGSENLKLLRLLSRTNYELGNLEDSKKFLKYLLFLNPNDEETISLLEKIEDRVPEKVLTDELPSVRDEKFDNKIQNEVFKDADEWVRVDAKTAPEEESKKSNTEDWNMGSVRDVREDLRKELKDELPQSISLDLVNVYQSQGLYERAKQILDQYLKVHPDKDEFLAKSKELEYLLKQHKKEVVAVQNIEDLPDELETEVESVSVDDLDDDPVQQKVMTIEADVPDAGPEIVKNQSARKEKLVNFLTAVKKRAESRKYPS